MKPTDIAKRFPLFSVLIANYNNGQYLEECLQSIFCQTYKNWEIILVDDGSTDSSFEVYQKYESYSQITIIELFSNKGCGFAKRKCVEAANGKICGFVDADDTLAPNALEITVKQHLDHPDHSIVYSTHYNCNGDLIPQNIAEQVGPIPDGQFSWMNKRPIISHFATFKRKNYLQTSGIAPWLHKAVDKDLYYKLEETGPTVFVNQPLYYYRHHQNSISLNENSNIAYQSHLAIKASIIIRSLDRANALKQMPHTKSELTRGLMQTALYLCKKNNYSSSFELLVKAVWYFPVHTLLLCLKSFYQKLLKPFFFKTKSTLFRIVCKDNHKNDKLNLAKVGENKNVSDNDAMVNVLISTIDERINEISAILVEKQPNVRYIISHQYTDPKYKTLPELLDRDDVILSQIPGRGLSRSRNNALRLVESGIALISDDDIRYLPGSFEKIREIFLEKLDTDVACFKIQTYEGEPEYKNYPDESYLINVKRRHYISSIEITFRVKKIKDNNIFFDERFGIGSGKFPVGEEEAFVQDCLAKELRVNYFPFYTVQHPYKSSTKRWPLYYKIQIAAALEARKSVPKAVGLTLFRTTWHILNLIKNKVNPFSYVFDCFLTIWYIYKTNKQNTHRY